MKDEYSPLEISLMNRLEVLQADNEAKEKRIQELEAALDEIINPIKYMQMRLKENEKLDGVWAIALSNDKSYLREIATKALTPPIDTKP